MDIFSLLLNAFVICLTSEKLGEIPIKNVNNFLEDI